MNKDKENALNLSVLSLWSVPLGLMISFVFVFGYVLAIDLNIVFLFSYEDYFRSLGLVLALLFVPAFGFLVVNYLFLAIENFFCKLLGFKRFYQPAEKSLSVLYAWIPVFYCIVGLSLGLVCSVLIFAVALLIPTLSKKINSNKTFLICETCFTLMVFVFYLSFALGILSGQMDKKMPFLYKASVFTREDGHIMFNNVRYLSEYVIGISSSSYNVFPKGDVLRVNKTFTTEIAFEDFVSYWSRQLRF